MSNIIDSIQLSGVTYTLSAQTGGGGVPESTFTAYTASTDSRITIDEEVTAAGLNALNEKITPTVELTQAQYDALVTAGTVSADTYYIITDAQAGDLTNYYTKSETNTLLGGKADTATTYTKTEVDNAITAATSTKQDTLVSGTNIKTINNTSLLGSGNIDIQGGGGGKAIEAGTNISVTTGETADTINCTIPAYFHRNTIKGDIDIGSNDGVNSDYGRLVIGRRVKSRANPYFQYSIGIGVQPDNSNNYCQLYGQNSVGIGRGFKIGSDTFYANGIDNAVAIGHNATSRSDGDVTLGASTTASGGSSVAIGSGATANGSDYKMNLNNQIKVTPTNQVYIYNKDNTEMICLQDQLGGGGGSITVDTALDSGSTNPVQNKALYDELRIIEPTETILQWVQSDGGYSSNYPSGCTKVVITIDEQQMTYGGYTLYNSNDDCLGFFSIESNGGVITVETRDCQYYEPTTSITYSISGNVVTVEYPTITNVTKIDTSYDNYWIWKAIVNNETPLIDQVIENEEVTAAALNALNDKFGGMKLVKLTQSEYNALSPNYDSNTLYVIVN